MDKVTTVEEERYNAIAENASVGILVINRSNCIVYANQFLVGLFGYKHRDEILNKEFEILIPKRYYEEHLKRILQVAYGAHKEDFRSGTEIYGVRKDGQEIPIEISLSSYQSGEETFFLAYLTDISIRMGIRRKLLVQKEEVHHINQAMEKMNERLEMEVEARTAKLRETMTKLEKSKDKLAVALNKEKDLSNMKSSFVSLASHEFRTPLSTILSSATLLLKYTKTEEQANRDKHVHRIQSAVTNLNNILNEFLSLRRIENGGIETYFENINIPELIDMQVQEMSSILKTGQKVQIKHTGENCFRTDKAIFKNIVINLLSNAIKFSEKKGIIYINTSIQDNILIFNIKDHGIGIPEKDLKYIGQLFFRAGNATNINGTGLGLNIVLKYAELLHGKVEIKSEPGKGTEFIITFVQHE